MKILGHIKSSFIDYPGKVATVIFLGGCNFKCGYCHNPALVKNIGEEIPQQTFINFLEKRKRFIDGVCISGGEPTLYDELYELAKKIKEAGYEIKLDTNGTNPKMIEKLIKDKLVDYVAMDIKGPQNRYEEITNVKVAYEEIQRSIKILKESEIDYEFRTTIHKEILAQTDMVVIAKHLTGAKKFTIQNFKRQSHVLDNEKQYTAYTDDELDEIHDAMTGHIQKIKIRR